MPAKKDRKQSGGWQPIEVNVPGEAPSGWRPIEVSVASGEVKPPASNKKAASPSTTKKENT